MTRRHEPAHLGARFGDRYEAFRDTSGQLKENVGDREPLEYSGNRQTEVHPETGGSRADSPW
jgi:hypothetical protein